ncbi:MAG: leucyl aminopeptidase [Pseudohongiellaceae bacterium]
MKYSIKAGAANKINTECQVVFTWARGALTDDAKVVDTSTGKVISKLLKAGDFSGELAQTSLLHQVTGVSAKRLLLVGLGPKSKCDSKAAVKALRAAFKTIQTLPATSAHFAISDVNLADRDSNWLVAKIAEEGESSVYRYTATKSKPPKAPAIKSITICPPNGARRKALDVALKKGAALGKGINRAKELGNLPGNICTPSYLADQAKQLGTKNKTITTQILGEKQMQRLGMGSLLSVSAGSAEEAKLIVMQYKGAKASSRPYALVGKGVTFDTGGISLKGGAAMDEMKYDMCGAASVIATMGCVAELKLPINVVAIVGAVENMPGSKATKPGDIVTSMSGKTIEILNTDAEGRLVLCDALTYLERFNPRSVIDIATLTGAAVATFGSTVSALLSNNDDFAQSLLTHGQQCGDPAWQLPLWDEYQGLLNSNFADIANIGGPRAGTITAACFLSRFTEKFTWAHLDIAGSAWQSGANKGATGRPVPLLVEYLSNQKA